MTKLEALQSMIDIEVSDNLVTKVLLDQGVTGSDDYSSSNEKEIDLCLAELYKHLAAKPDLSEGDLSVKLDRNVLLSLREDILRKYNLLDGVISDASNRW